MRRSVRSILAACALVLVAVETARALGARRTYLTHLTHETGHAALLAELPPGIEPAYDGLVVEVQDSAG